MQKLALCLAATCMATSAQAANLGTNGNFESGNTGFTSAYALSGSNTTEGQYAILSNPFPWNSSFLSRGDHTTGTGLMFVGNGAPTAGQVVWQSGIIPISQLTTYFFEAFVMNVCCGPSYVGVNSDPILTFRIALNGGSAQDLATLSIPANQSGIWFGLTTNFNSGSATSAVLSLINSNTVRGGNDFAIDDINLDTRSVVTPVPEPATWAMMLAGFGIAGIALRQRRRLSARIA